MNACCRLKIVVAFLRSEVNATREELGDEAAARLDHLTRLKVDLLDNLATTFNNMPSKDRQQVASNGPAFMAGWDMDPHWSSQHLPERVELLEWLELDVKKVGVWRLTCTPRGSMHAVEGLAYAAHVCILI